MNVFYFYSNFLALFVAWIVVHLLMPIKASWYESSGKLILENVSSETWHVKKRQFCPAARLIWESTIYKKLHATAAYQQRQKFKLLLLAVPNRRRSATFKLLKATKNLTRSVVNEYALSEVSETVCDLTFSVVWYSLVNNRYRILSKTWLMSGWLITHFYENIGLFHAFKQQMRE